MRSSLTLLKSAVMKKFVSLVISVAILLIIYSQIDFDKLIKVLQNCDLFWMTISLLMFIPLTLLTSWRLQQLMPSHRTLGFIEANRLILGASVLNMILPSKMGDIAKAYFLKDRGHLSGSLSLSLVIFEKACDLLSLLFWCVFGLIVYPHKNELFWVMTLAVAGGLFFGIILIASPSFALLFFQILAKALPKKMSAKLDKISSAWREMHDYFWEDKKQLTWITLNSIFTWFLHLVQIWLFILALKAWTPFLINLALSPLAILAGLLPLTFAGVGTRDAALILFYQPYFNEATGAALGLLCTSRYLLPAIAGLPFLSQMMGTLHKKNES